MLEYSSNETLEHNLRMSEAGHGSRPLLENILSDLELQRRTMTEVSREFFDREGESLLAIEKKHQELLNERDDERKLEMAQEITQDVKSLINKLTLAIEPEHQMGYLWEGAHELAGIEASRVLPFITLSWERTSHGRVSTGCDVGIKHWDNVPEGLSETVQEMIETDQHLNNLWHLDKLLALRPSWNVDRGGSFNLPSNMSEHLERSFSEAVSEITAQIYYGGERNSAGWKALGYSAPEALTHRAHGSMLRNRLRIVQSALITHFDTLSPSVVINPHHAVFTKAEKRVKSK